MANCIHIERVKSQVNETQFLILKALTCSNLRSAYQIVSVYLVTYGAISILYQTNAAELALSNRLSLLDSHLG
jgi:hypothetical protein